ncbi:winged helix-turn-helix transcriptional regulator [Halolamina sp. CBA1230]|uniref:winged helix-turn-helix domain-containing protein n=1 Tax=Halolamina sp. CBA1230 TaxID=1853690 RepID=UPI0009A22FAF|nr:winged helix-turn-helix domain-containing protein [Halolamina sp. CBA1230]QKY21345.1 winged helix-turn-helix transcriptional regulator [Halolamina sp. CBA1230]
MGLVSESKLRILQSIQKEPTYGYELAETLDLSSGYVYTHLKELREEGMIEVTEEEGDRKIYQLTENGELLLQALED